MEKLNSQELHRLISENANDSKEILAQVKKTNGRVGELERWQSFMKGGLSVLTIMFLPILLIVIKLLLDK